MLALFIVEIRPEDLEIKNYVGRTAMCKIDEALWKSKNKLVSLKTFYYPDIGSEEVNDFKRELWLTSHMDHPNLVRFLGGSSDPPNLYIVTELVKNGSLWEILHDKQRILPGPLRLRMAYELAQGMAYLHSKNILHRDLKSENVLVGQIDPPGTEPVVKIANLGIARWKRPTADITMTAGRGTQQWSTVHPLLTTRLSSSLISLFFSGTGGNAREQRLFVPS